MNPHQLTNYFDLMLVLFEKTLADIAEDLTNKGMPISSSYLSTLRSKGFSKPKINDISELLGWPFYKDNLHLTVYKVPKSLTLRKVLTTWLVEQEEFKRSVQVQLAEMLGLDPQTFSTYKARGSFTTVQLHILMGHLRLEEPDHEKLVLDYLSKLHPLEVENKTTESEDTLSIPITNLQPSAGLGTGIIDLIKSEIMESVKINREWLLTQFPNINLAKPLGLCKIRGDSMVPTFNPSDTVLVEQCQSFSEDGVYVFEAESNLYIKRVQKVPFAGCKIISDNQAYDALELNNEQITKINVLAKVIGCYSFKKVA